MIDRELVRAYAAIARDYGISCLRVGEVEMTFGSAITQEPVEPKLKPKVLDQQAQDKIKDVLSMDDHALVNELFPDTHVSDNEIG